jgi:hypothetical protein
MYEFYDPNSHATIQIATRSTWGIYQFLGDLVQRQLRLGLLPKFLGQGFDRDDVVFKVVTDGSTECFTAIRYAGLNYCVPKDRPNSKMILSLLHELSNLYTRPSTAQQPNTGTVRLTQ